MGGVGEQEVETRSEIGKWVCREVVRGSGRVVPGWEFVLNEEEEEEETGS
jgi:hypothetical protein